MAKKPKLRRFFGETKPKHDELTKWTSAGTLKSSDIVDVYRYSYGWSTPANSPLLASIGLVADIGSVTTDISDTIAAPTIDWGDLTVGQTCDVHTLREYAQGKLRTVWAPGYWHLFAEDGSEGAYDPMTGVVTKTKGPDPVATPDDIEETTELVIGWRTFTVKDYKLRGSWNTWESRVFHASCNCAEFDNPYRLELPVIDERRDLMRQHLAAGTGTCGVYSRKSLELYKDYRTHSDELRVAAKCVNYGLGYEYDGGYRSEFSRIEHLFILMKGDVAAYAETIYSADYLKNLPPISSATLAQILSTTYGVPCDVMSPLEFAYKHDEGML